MLKLIDHYCINALGDKKKKGIFINYWDSKLIWLLIDSYVGNCKIIMIINISFTST